MSTIAGSAPLVRLAYERDDGSRTTWQKRSTKAWIRRSVFCPKWSVWPTQSFLQLNPPFSKMLLITLALPISIWVLVLRLNASMWLGHSWPVDLWYSNSAGKHLVPNDKTVPVLSEWKIRNCGLKRLSRWCLQFGRLSGRTKSIEAAGLCWSSWRRSWGIGKDLGVTCY